MEKTSLIIVSGGVDSVTLLYERAHEIALGLSFDYGSNHNQREIPFARYHCERLGIEHLTIHLDFIHDYFRSGLLEGASAVPDGPYSEENIKATVVPFRNGIMLSIATGLAQCRGLGKVLIANHSTYLDCKPAFIEAFDKATRTGTPNAISVDAPYTNLSKAEVCEIGKRLGIDYSKTWSCYKGGNLQCGKCSTCIERKEAFEHAEINDLTEYEIK